MAGVAPLELKVAINAGVAEKTLERLEAAMRKFGTGLPDPAPKKGPEAATKFKNELKKLTDAHKAGDIAAKEYASELKKLQAGLVQVRTTTGSASREHANMTAVLGSTQTALKRVERQMGVTTVATDKNTRATGRGAKAGKKANRSSKAMGIGLIQLQEATMKVTQANVNWGYVLGDVMDALAVGGLKFAAATAAMVAMAFAAKELGMDIDILNKSLLEGDRIRADMVSHIDGLSESTAKFRKEVVALEEAEKNQGKTRKQMLVEKGKLTLEDLKLEKEVLKFRAEQIRELQSDYEEAYQLELRDLDIQKDRAEVFAHAYGKHRRVMDQLVESQQTLFENIRRVDSALQNVEETQNRLLGVSEKPTKGKGKAAKKKTWKIDLVEVKNDWEKAAKIQTGILDEVSDSLKEYGDILTKTEEHALVTRSVAAWSWLLAHRENIGVQVALAQHAKDEETRIAGEGYQERLELREKELEDQRQRIEKHMEISRGVSDEISSSHDQVMSSVASQGISSLNQFIKMAVAGEENAAQQVAASFLSSIGQQIVGIGIKQIIEGTGISLTGHPAGPALVAHGTAALAVGAAMGASGAAMSGALATKSGGAKDSKEKTPLASGGSRTDRDMTAPPVNITITYGVTGPDPEATAIAVAQAIELGRRRGIA